MEAFGRIIAVCLAGVGTFFLMIFSKKSVLYRQKELTVQSLTRTCAAQMMEEHYFDKERIQRLSEELSQLGDFTVECIVMEKLRFDSEAGSRELYRVCEKGSGILTKGSLVRVFVTEKRTRGEVFLYGPGCVCLAGGRVF